MNSEFPIMAAQFNLKDAMISKDVFTIKTNCDQQADLISNHIRTLLFGFGVHSAKVCCVH